MKNLKSRNLSTTEVAYRPLEVPASLEPCAYFLQGVLQTVRDYLTIKYKKEVRIVMISGYRSPEVNAATPGSADNSNHMWKLSPLKVAADITSPDVTTKQLYDAVRTLVRGEVYVNYAQKKVHVAPCGPIKEPWVAG